jgi:hypothetical protein
MPEPKGQRQVVCPTCGKPAPFTKENRWRPFCSERCKLIDLGAWFDESNRVPGRQEPDDDHFPD